MSYKKIKTLSGAREYAEEMDVELGLWNGRMVIKAFNEAGCNCTMVDWGDTIRSMGEYLGDVLEQVHAIEETE